MFITKIRFHWQAFTVYIIGENLKIMTEIFYPKLIVSNVILKRYQKPKIFFVNIECPPFSKSLDPPLISHIVI